jgi:hypothetical protein
MTRARVVLARGPDPRFEPYDRFRHRERNRGRSLASLLDEFERLRAANLTELQSWRLGPDELALTGVHPTFGRVTLAQLLAAWVAHDLGRRSGLPRDGQRYRCGRSGRAAGFDGPGMASLRSPKCSKWTANIGNAQR